MDGKVTNMNKKFEDVKYSAHSEQEGIVATDDYIALNWTFKDCVVVLEANDFKRIAIDTPMIKGHKGAVTDLAFSPFKNNLLSTSCEDNCLRLFMLDEAGMSQQSL